MQPYILLTVHRRYNFLEKNLEHIQTRLGDFKVQPRIIVVAADMEAGKVEWFEEQVRLGRIYAYVPRLRMPNEDDLSITEKEALNLEIGWYYISANAYQDDYYCIIQASDCYAVSYKEIDELMDGTVSCMVCFWRNHLTEYAFHTNFVVVNSDKLNWPFPSTDAHNVLEWQYYWKLNTLRKTGLLGKYILLDNSNDQTFLHTHEEDTLESWLNAKITD